MITRTLHHRLQVSLAEFPAVVLIGPRQVGKTTLARELLRDRDGIYLDLERPSHRAQLADPELFLSGELPGLVVLDEVQRVPELFAVLRGVIDDDRRPGRFLLLGSASPDLLQRFPQRAASETLAGRVDILELEPFSLTETADHAPWRDLWWRGGFPDALLARSDAAARRWQDAFLRTWVERDLPALGSRVDPLALRRFLDMVASVHGQLWNGARLAASLGVSQPTVARYRDLLEHAWLLRVLRPFHVNRGKRLVRAPRVFIRDSGLLHALLRVADRRALPGHAVVGASFEGFVIEQALRTVGDAVDASFWRTRGGAEIDLLLHRGEEVLALVEVKHSSAPRLGRGFHQARADLGSPPAFVVHPGDGRWPMAPGVEAIGVADLPGALAL